jgi:hypothetical protein
MWSRRTIIGAVCLVVATVGSASASGLPCEFARAAVCALHSLLSLKRRPQNNSCVWAGPALNGVVGRWQSAMNKLQRDARRSDEISHVCLTCLIAGLLMAVHDTPRFLLPTLLVNFLWVAMCLLRVGWWVGLVCGSLSLSLFHRLLLFTHSITIATTDPAVLFTYPWLCLNVVLGRR